MAMFRLGSPDDDCPSQRIGNCTLTTACVPSSTTDYVSAGTVKVTAETPLVNVVMDPVEGSSYISQAFAATLSEGNRLRVEASGATAPAFSTELIVAAPLLVSAPSADSDGVILANSSRDLTLSFQSGSSGALLAVQGVSAEASASCQSPSGQLTIASTVLVALGSGTMLKVTTLAERDLTLGSWQLRIGYMTEARAAATLQPVRIRIE